MTIKLIDIIVHPDFFAMTAPYSPLHERQLVVREKWEERFNMLEKRKDALLLYFSDMTWSKINQGLKDSSSTSNKIELDEIERIKRCKAKLGKRFILFGWFEIPDSKDLTEMFATRGFTYIPQETKVHASGEILEVCVFGWGNNTASVLGIPNSNIEFSREESLTNDDCGEILNWRVNKMVNLFMAS